MLSLMFGPGVNLVALEVGIPSFCIDKDSPTCRTVTATNPLVFVDLMEKLRSLRPAWCCLMECPKCGAGPGVWCLTDSPTPNGKRLPLHEERWGAAGKYGSVGWHTFRHTYRSWLDDTGAPVGVQQKLMRHAQVSTTMNIYGNALMGAKREANSKVVKMALRSA